MGETQTLRIKNGESNVHDGCLDTVNGSAVDAEAVEGKMNNNVQRWATGTKRPESRNRSSSQLPENKPAQKPSTAPPQAIPEHQSMSALHRPKGRSGSTVQFLVPTTNGTHDAITTGPQTVNFRTLVHSVQLNNAAVPLELRTSRGRQQGMTYSSVALNNAILLCTSSSAFF